MKILMIRHFPTPGNIEKRYVGRTDEELAGKDLEIQVRTVRRRLKDHGSVEYVAASPMKRCVQTAALLFAGRAPLLFDELRECDFGLFEGHNYEELKDLPVYREWLASKGELPFPGGESHDAFKDRCVSGFSRAADCLMRKGCRRAGMVVHGGTIMAVLSRFDPKQRGFYEWQPENGGGYAVTLDEDEWKQGRIVFTEIEVL